MQTHQINPLKPYDNQDLVMQVNYQLKRISLRLNQQDGSVGTPGFQSPIDLKSNRVMNVGMAIQPLDAVSLSFADDRYVKSAPGLLNSLVNGAVPGLGLDAGIVTFTGTGTAIVRLSAVSFVCATLNTPAGANLYPGVTYSLSGSVITFQTWMPTVAGAVNPNATPIQSTQSATVSWIAIGASTVPTQPSGPGGGGGSGGFGAGGVGGGGFGRQSGFQL